MSLHGHVTHETYRLEILRSKRGGFLGREYENAYYSVSIIQSLNIIMVQFKIYIYTGKNARDIAVHLIEGGTSSLEFSDIIIRHSLGH